MRATTQTSIINSFNKLISFNQLETENKQVGIKLDW